MSNCKRLKVDSDKFTLYKDDSDNNEELKRKIPGCYSYGPFGKRECFEVIKAKPTHKKVKSGKMIIKCTPIIAFLSNNKVIEDNIKNIFEATDNHPNEAVVMGSKSIIANGKLISLQTPQVIVNFPKTFIDSIAPLVTLFVFIDVTKDLIDINIDTDKFSSVNNNLLIITNGEIDNITPNLVLKGSQSFLYTEIIKRIRQIIICKGLEEKSGIIIEGGTLSLYTDDVQI